MKNEKCCGGKYTCLTALSPKRNPERDSLAGTGSCKHSTYLGSGLVDRILGADRGFDRAEGDGVVCDVGGGGFKEGRVRNEKRVLINIL